jgi:hypothetical protein
MPTLLPVASVGHVPFAVGSIVGVVPPVIPELEPLELPLDPEECPDELPLDPELAWPLELDPLLPPLLLLPLLPEEPLELASLPELPAPELADPYDPYPRSCPGPDEPPPHARNRHGTTESQSLPGPSSLIGPFPSRDPSWLSV